MIKLRFRHMPLILTVALVFFSLSLTSYSVDLSLAKQYKKPVFSLHYMSINDGGSSYYIGLGYQIIMWRKMTGTLSVYKMGTESYYLWGFKSCMEDPGIPLEVRYDG
ncbi:hypothetical protein [Candidatus Soleaferrea massiliensis]|uniref:hypothetical protein n=1 Tax=Candidatus Soleaferrea massiliensis TaxID=1470354 RepID=UPI0012E01780|nr:hypothetical protein [Candidatus Soleaferrea massiliensis]